MWLWYVWRVKLSTACAKPTLGCWQRSDIRKMSSPVLSDSKWGIWTVLSREASTLPGDTCISPGKECQKMSGGLLHMWLAFLLCSPSHSSQHLHPSGSPCSRNQVWLKVLCRTWGPFHLCPGIPSCRFCHTCLPGQWHLDWHQRCLQRWALLGVSVCWATSAIQRFWQCV